MSHTRSTARPYLMLVGITLGLMVLMGLVGTVCYLVGVDGYAPLVLGFMPIAIVTAVVLTRRRAWGTLGFRKTRLTRSALGAMALASAVPLSVLVAAGGVAARGQELLMFAGFAVLVGFVEETLFRGVLYKAFHARGAVVSVLAPSLGFAAAHVVTALSPDQDSLAIARTVLFALLFGVIAALLVRLTSSIWPAIVLHAVFDFASFVLIPRSAVASDVLSITVAVAVVASLTVMTIRATRRSTPAPAPAPALVRAAA